LGTSFFCVVSGEAACLAAPPVFNKALEVYNPKQSQNDEDDDDNDQNMDPTACLREAWANPSTEKAEQPQDE